VDFTFYHWLSLGFCTLFAIVPYGGQTAAARFYVCLRLFADRNRQCLFLNRRSTLWHQHSRLQCWPHLASAFKSVQ